MTRAVMLRLGVAGSTLLLVLMFAGSALAAELTFDLPIEHGQVAEAKRLVRVHQGDVVQLRWTSDQPLTVHLHGYDIEKRVAAQGVTEMNFTAGTTGRFPIELHSAAAGGGTAHGAAPLAVLEVYPR